MSSTFEHLVQTLKKLPGLGFRSAERLALHLLVEEPDQMAVLQAALAQAEGNIRRCLRCGHMAEADYCSICEDPRRESERWCLVERVPDLLALEQAAAWRGRYHVLHGKLSPLKGIGPEALNLANLPARLAEERPTEVVLALSNDIEGEATCHYLQENFFARPEITVTRIGFGVPSGSGLTLVDATTLQNALTGRRVF